MKLTITRVVALAVIGAAVALNATATNAQQIDTAVSPAMSPSQSILGLERPNCRHVINLLLRNQHRKRVGLNAPNGAELISPHIHGPLPGDLELAEIAMVSPGDANQGPQFQITLRNNSDFTLRDFAISIVGVFGRIHLGSPSTTINVSRMDPRQSGAVQIALPVDSLAMGTFNGQPVPFDTLVVAIDSYDELVERDELNNVAILPREGIKALVVEAAEPSTTPTVPSPKEPVPATPLAPENGPLPTLPGDKPQPTPLDEIDLDKLDFDGLDLDGGQKEDTAFSK
jgi:hypothetical protein